MVTKMLIQVISVVTLVFGTCYQSVQALASNTKRIEIQSARLIDEENTAPATVKAGSKHDLVVNLTISNKDGDDESGTTQLWVPQDQLELLTNKATFETDDTEDNARLVYEKLSNNQLQLSWQKVARTASFKVELPVKVKQAMTEMQLPIAVGSATDYLQPLTVLNEAATDDAVAEITGDPGLPGNILANLDQYLTTQQAQEEAEAAAAKQEADAAAQKEAEEQAKADAAAKAEAEAAEKKAAEKKAAEDKAKQEAEDKEEAEKVAAAKKEKEQQEADEEKETAKTKATLKARSAKATEESVKSKEKEADDKAETKGTNLGQKLQQAANGGTPKSFFNTITLKNGNREQDVSANNSEINMDIYANEEFELIYSWDMDKLKEKLGTTKIELGDFYTFKIYGLKELDSNGGGVIKSGNTELATYAYKNVTVDGEYAHQEVTITFDKAIALQTSAKFDLTIKQQLIGGDPVIFEYNEEAIVTGVPDQVLNSIVKSGKFVGDQIEWTVTLKAELFSKSVTFDEITITDVLGSGHDYVTKDGKLSGWTITHGGENVTGQFTATETGVFKGETVTELEGDLVITFLTKPDDGVKQTTFKNTVSADVGNQKTNTIGAEVSSFSVEKEAGKIVHDNDKLLYEWQLQVNLANIAVSKESLASMTIVDTVQGNHKFDESQLELAVYLNANKTGDDLSGYFKKEISTDGKQLKLKVDLEKAAELASEVGDGSKLYFSYQTVPIAGDITDVQNKAEVSVNGMVTNTDNKGTDGKGKLIVKNGKYDDSKTGAVVDWTLNVNPSKWEWSKLTITDELPEYISETNISKIKIGNTELKIGQKGNLEDGTKVTVTVIPDDKKNFNKIQLTFENIKQDYEVKFTTTHAWDGGAERKLTNKATATTSEGYSETDSDTVTIRKRIAGNVFKDGKNQLANSIEAGKNHVQWRVGFGTRLDNNFSGKKGDINTVTIEETLNGDGPNYLSFPTKETDYRLHEISKVGTGDNSSVMGDEIDRDDYTVALTPDKDNQNKLTIQITFKGEQYKQLMLVFATPIDLDAWFDEDADEPSEMKGYEFKNAAEVSYDGFKPVKVTGQTSLDKNGVYGSKNGTAVKDSREISWEAILNADGKRLTNVTITDELSKNHEYQNKEDIKLYTADVRHRVDGDQLTVEVVGKKAIDPADYTIEGDLDNPRTFLIKLKQPLTTALLIEYTTTRTSTSSQTYTNKVKLSSNEVLIEADAKETISASGEIWGFDARFKKIIGDDKDRPLGGATFKLQEKEYTAADDDPDAWRDATDIRGNAISEITSPESGNFVIRDLKTYSDFRLIETASAEGYDHHIEPITFNKAAVEDSDWLETKYYVKNWPVTKRTALSISKEVTGLTNQSFEFKVSAKIDGKLDTSFNGTYPIAQSNETVTFENGIVTFNLSKDQTIKITQLPVYLPGKDLEKRQYEIEEVKAETDNFETQVSVDNEKPVAGTTTGEIGLEDDGDKHTAVFFHNSLTTGNFILSKQVNEADEQTDPTATFKFKVAATLDGQAYSPIRELFEAYRINANGSIGSKEPVKFIDGQLMRVSDSDEVDVITLKANEQYMVKDLPEGLSLQATELTPGHYHVTSQPAGQLDEGNYVTEAVVVPDKTVSLNTTITVANALPVGNLRLNKDVLNQKPGDDNLDFEFTLTIDGEDALRGQEFFEVTGLSKQDDVQFKYDEDQKQHLATLKLKHNDRATIVGLPKGVKVTITEKTHDGFSTTYQVNNGDQESQDEDGPTVTIPDGKAITVSYENARPVTGKLHIEKAGNNLPADQNFKFKITALDDTKLTGTYEGVLKQRGDDEGTNHEVEFKAGEANTDLKAGQYLVIQDLPLGRYVVSEKATDGFAASWTVTAQDGSNSDETPANDDGYYQVKPAKVTEKTTPQVVYTNSVVTGKLEVSKHVASTKDKDLNDNYHFEITATKDAAKVRNNDYEMVVNNIKETLSFSGDTAKLTLKHGESALINGLPVGVKLTVKEVLDEDSALVATWLIGDEEDYQELDDQHVPEVTINNDKTSAVAYKNTRTPDGELVVKKAIEGDVDADRSFKFNVSMVAEETTYLSGKYQVRIYNERDTLLTNDPVSVENDQLTLNLKGGQWAVIVGLPLAKYQVEEVDPDVTGMQTTWTVNSGDEQTNAERLATLTTPLTEDGRQTIAFTNRLGTGQLQVNKHVASHQDADLTADYKFEITATKHADKVRGNEYPVVIDNDKQTLVFTDDTAKLTLKHGETATISGLPIGVKLTVKEIVADGSQLAATWLIEGEGTDYQDLTDRNVPEVTIDDTKASAVSYKNTRTPDGELVVKKAIEGDVKASQSFAFNVSLATDESAKLTDAYQVRTYDAKGDLITNDSVPVKNDQLSFNLQGGQWAVITGLPLAKYQVQEVDPEVNGMQTSWTVNSGNQQTNDDRLATLTKPLTVTGRQTIAFTNRLGTGQLQVNKHVASHNDADLNAEYQFELTATKHADKVRGNDYKLVVNNQERTLAFRGDTAELTLKHGETALISGLPIGVQLTVKEIVADDNQLTATWLIEGDGADYQALTDENVPEVTIDDVEASVVSYKNTRTPDGELVVKKAIEGDIKADQSFDFNVSLVADASAKLADAYQVRTYDAQNTLVSNKPVNVNDGQLNLSLVGGQWAVIEGLPLAKYQVKEVDPEVNGMQTSWTVNSGQAQTNADRLATLTEPLTVNGRQTVAFTNRLGTGQLQVNKHVASHQDADLNADYKFEITATKNADKVRGNEYPVVIDNDKQTLVFNGDTAKLTLKHGETATISGLPIGVKLTVKEIVEKDSQLAATWLIEGEGAKYQELTDENVPEVTIDDVETSTVSYKNTRTPDGELVVKKTIEGDVKASQSFQFNVSVVAGESAKLVDAYQVRTYDAQGTLLTDDQIAVDKKGQLTLNLKGGQWAVILGLPLAKYQVKEVDPKVAGMQTSWTVNSGQTQTNADRLATLTKPLTVTGRQTVAFTNRLGTGQLQVNKHVASHREADLNADYKFEITATKNADKVRGNEYSVVIDNDKQTLIFNNDTAKLTLKHGETAIISGLPIGVQLSVKEIVADDSQLAATWLIEGQGNDYQDLDDRHVPKVTIGDNKTSIVSYKNTRDPDGELVVKKAIEGDVKASQSFRFNVSVADDDSIKLADAYQVRTYDAQGTLLTDDQITVENDRLTLDLKGGQWAVIAGLPLAKYQVEEVDPEVTGMQTSWTVNSGDEQSNDDRLATLTKPLTVTGRQTVAFTNRLGTGQLQVNKHVASHQDADLNAAYKFEITATKNADKVRGNEYPVVIDNDKQTLVFNGDTAKLTLKHGETATINGLPIGVELTVKEIVDEDSQLTATWLIEGEATDYQALTDQNVPEVTIDDVKANAVSYKNTRTPDGELVVKKAIKGDVEASQSFDFNVSLVADETAKLADAYQVRTYDAQNMLISSNSVKVNNDGQLNLSLAGGQWAVIEGLPLAKYQVKEVDPEVAGMQTTWTVNSGKEQNGDDRLATLTDPLTVNGRQTVAFTNVLETGKLQVNKHVASHLDKDLNATYTFDLEVQGANVDRVNGNTYKVTGNDKQPDLTFEGGKAVLQIQGSGSVVVDGLPTGITVLVKERVDENDDLAASWLVGIDGDYESLTDDKYPEVKIQADKDGVVSYKNTRNPDGELKVEKVIKGNLDADQQFNFAIRATNVAQPLNKTYQVRTYDQNGNVVQTKDVSVDNGDININLTGGHSAIISGLPLATYQVQEADAEIDHMVTSWTLNHEGNATYSSLATLKDALTAAGMQTVTFTNEVPEGDLRIEKIAEGTYSSTDKIKFTIQADNRLTGDYNGILYQADSAKEIGKVAVEFNQGEATVAFKPGQYLMISGLPVQGYQVEEAKQDDDVVTTWETNTETGDGVVADAVTTKENHTASVTFTNRINVGSLTLNKWVASQRDDDLKTAYQFTLQADDAAMVAGKQYDVTGHAETTHVTFNADGQAKLTMTHDTPVTINGLPVGLKVTVTETTTDGFVATWRVNNAGDYVELTDDDQPTITIDDTHTQVVSYKNTRDPEGQLQIEKQVTGAIADEDASYDFIIEALDATTGEAVTSATTTLLDLNGNYSVLIYQSGTDKLLHKDTVEFDKGQATLALKADQYAVVSGLPLHTYQVREVDPEVANMSTSWSVNGGKLTAGLQADAHELTADGVMTVLFNNAVQTGDLSIEKQVTGAVTEADEQQAYDFTVTAYWEAADGKVEVDTDYNQQHAATLTAANGAATTIRLDFKKGELAVSLKAGERLTIHNLDENRVVTVTETPLADFITTHRIGTEAVTAGNETRQITIGDDVTKHVTFINDKPATPEVAWLSLTKSVLGSAGETDRGFDFTVQLVDHLQQPITGIVKVVKTTATGTYVSGEMLFDDHGTATVTLQHNETVKLEVPNGAHYQIAETDYSADGYVTTTSQGGNPERAGLAVTGIAHQVDPSTALVVYYNRADTTDPDDEIAHTDTDDDQAMPELVGPATDDGSGTGTTGANPQAHTGTGGTGTSGTVAPQAYTSGSSKGILPQTGEFLRNHWVAVLGWLLLMVLIGMMVWRYRLNKES